MAIGVDTSKWKPRKIIGTPASKFRNILGIGILTVGLITGVIFQYVYLKLYFIKTLNFEVIMVFSKQELVLNSK